MLLLLVGEMRRHCKKEPKISQYRIKKKPVNIHNCTKLFCRAFLNFCELRGGLPQIGHSRGPGFATPAVTFWA
jgi:hypothetical protein